MQHANEAEARREIRHCLLRVNGFEAVDDVGEVE
jgi:hypothetical protein